ncbi:MAG: urea transporter [Pirellulales bacterium]
MFGIHGSSSTLRPSAWPAARLLSGLAEVFFLGQPMVGLAVIGATWLHWPLGAAGLLCVAAADGFGRLIGMSGSALSTGCYRYNPLLVGLSLGATLNWSWPTVGIIILAGAVTLLATTALAQLLRQQLALPVLSLPFVLVAATLQTAILRYPSLALGGSPLPAYLLQEFGLPPLAAGFFKTLGAILFMPCVPIGMLLATVVLWRSRILLFLAAGGYLLAIGLRVLWLGSAEQALADVSAFNSILVAMALGGVFLVPSGRGFAIAAVAVATTVLVADGLSLLGQFFTIPTYTLPFNLVALGSLYGLAVVPYPGISRLLAGTPEETLEIELIRRRRFADHSRTLALPFLGQWTVYQGCDGEWTHQGDWRHACDFVITDEDGQMFSGRGIQLADYYCFRKPVLAPCRGTVVSAVGDLPDNPVGRVDKANNWGNHVVIHDDRGFHVELSHFAHGSLKVQPGDRVEPGQPLGLCGNSGYSPQPHLHIHVQAAEQVGSPTMPFAFSRFVEGNLFHAQHMPARGSVVEPAGIDRALDAASDYLLHETLDFDLFRCGAPAGQLQLTVRMALDGTLYFEGPEGSRLYFGKHDGALYFYRVEGNNEWLRTLLLALPRLPLVRGRALVWHDVLPIGLAAAGPRRWLAQFAAAFVPAAGCVQTTHRVVQGNIIETQIEAAWCGLRCAAHVELSRDGGIALVRVDDLELRSQAADCQPPMATTPVVTRHVGPPLAANELVTNIVAFRSAKRRMPRGEGTDAGWNVLPTETAGTVLKR